MCGSFKTTEEQKAIYLYFIAVKKDNLFRELHDCKRVNYLLFLQ